MKVLVIGSGGREHALVWKISQSPRVNQIYCSPGNAGISDMAECIPIQPSDIQSLLAFAKDHKIDLTIVGPEVPLTLGITDLFRRDGMKIFGPSRAAARLEGSKIFSKQILNRYNIPTPGSLSFTDMEKAVQYISEKGAPIVVKADGLAAGKGVVVARTDKDAVDAIRLMMEEKAFGPAGDKIIIEDFLEGEETSFLVFTDGKYTVPMPLAKDHKRVFDGDRGPNTGGMGAYSPVPSVSKEMCRRIMTEIVEPVIHGLEKEGCLYEGILYAGLMITSAGPKVLEFNCRFGDPEAQPVLMKLETDIIDIFESVIEHRLEEMTVTWSGRSAVCVVMTSDGYPGQYQTGQVISGLKDAGLMKDVMVFHAGTASDKGNVVTAGGRVLGVTSLGNDLKDAVENAYEAVRRINFSGMHYRRDIGKDAGGLNA